MISIPAKTIPCSVALGLSPPSSMPFEGTADCAVVVVVAVRTDPVCSELKPLSCIDRLAEGDLPRSSSNKLNGYAPPVCSLLFYEGTLSPAIVYAAYATRNFGGNAARLIARVPHKRLVTVSIRSRRRH